jgi:hypothetical protein
VVANNLLRESKSLEHVLEVELCHPFGCDGLVAWDEDGRLGAVMILSKKEKSTKSQAKVNA